MRWFLIATVVAAGLAAFTHADRADAQSWVWRPYDPYKWCAVYSGPRGGGAMNCGFLTLEQCRLTVSGVGGSCEPNQFYNPHRGRRR